jgi:hypothetical protein
LHFEGEQAIESVGKLTSKQQLKKRMSGEGLLTKLTFAGAEAESLTQMPLKICSFYENTSSQMISGKQD